MQNATKLRKANSSAFIPCVFCLLHRSLAVQRFLSFSSSSISLVFLSWILFSLLSCLLRLYHFLHVALPLSLWASLSPSSLILFPFSHPSFLLLYHSIVSPCTSSPSFVAVCLLLPPRLCSTSPPFHPPTHHTITTFLLLSNHIPKHLFRSSHWPIHIISQL